MRTEFSLIIHGCFQIPVTGLAVFFIAIPQGLHLLVFLQQDFTSFSQKGLIAVSTPFTTLGYAHTTIIGTFHVSFQTLCKEVKFLIKHKVKVHHIIIIRIETFSIVRVQGIIHSAEFSKCLRINGNPLSIYNTRSRKGSCPIYIPEQTFDICSRTVIVIRFTPVSQAASQIDFHGSSFSYIHIHVHTVIVTVVFKTGFVPVRVKRFKKSVLSKHTQRGKIANAL